jgi:hypothetical protein
MDLRTAATELRGMSEELRTTRQGLERTTLEAMEGMADLRDARCAMHQKMSALITAQRGGWKQATPAPIDRHKNYSPAEVAALWGVSYNTAARRMEKMKGCVDIGVPERMHRRRKRIHRVPGSALLEYMRSKQN